MAVNVAFHGTGDYSQVERENAKLHRDLVKLRQQLAGAAAESKRGSTEAANAKEIEAKGLSAVVKQVGLVQRGHGELSKTIKGVADEQRRMNEVAKKGGTEAERATAGYRAKLGETMRLLQGVRAGTIDAGSAQRKLAELARETGDAHEQAFGRQAMESVAGMAMAYGSITRVIGEAIRALRDLDAERQAAAAKAVESRMDVGALAQVAESPGQFLDLKKKAETLQASGAVPSLSAGAQVTFALQSAGELETNFDLFKKMGEAGLFPNMESLAASSRAMEASFGKGETGDMRAIVSKALAASSFAPSSAEDLLAAAAQSGGTAKTLGLRDEDLLAATAVSATAAKGAEKGGTRIRALLTSLEEAGNVGQAQRDLEKAQAELASFQETSAAAPPRTRAQETRRAADLAKREKAVEEARAQVAQTQAISKGSLAERLQFVQSHGGVTGEQFGQFFGRVEARQGFRDVLGNLDQYQGAVSKIDKAQREDLVGKKLAFFRADPSLVAARARQAAEGQRAVASEPLGTAENIWQARQDEWVAQRRQQGKSELVTWLGQQASQRDLINKQVTVGAIRKRLDAGQFDVEKSPLPGPATAGGFGASLGGRFARLFGGGGAPEPANMPVQPSPVPALAGPGPGQPVASEARGPRFDYDKLHVAEGGRGDTDRIVGATDHLAAGVVSRLDRLVRLQEQSNRAARRKTGPAEAQAQRAVGGE